jgi:hypothetical protein
MFSRGLIQPLTDSDLDATNDRYADRWHTSHDGLAPASWSDAKHHALIYLLVVVVCSGASSLLFWSGVWG